MVQGSSTDFDLLEAHWGGAHRATLALESVGFRAERLGPQVGTLSGGERIRLALLTLKEQGAQFFRFEGSESPVLILFFMW